jgi:hypothetical protein
MSGFLFQKNKIMNKSVLFIAFLILVFGMSCKTKHKTEATVNKNEQVTNSNDTRTNGKVSHQYRAGGCATVIIIARENQDKPLTLIPSKPISSEFDTDGMTIKFNYLPLKMRNPNGCLVGIPAEITNISK